MTNIDPLTGEPLAISTKPVNGIEDNKSIQFPIDLAAIEGMDAEGLRKLIRTVLQAGYGIKGISIAELTNNAIKTDNELYDALMLKGVTLAINASDWKEYHALASFWSERKQGKAVMRIESKIEHSGKMQSNELTNEQLINALRAASVAGLLPGNTSLTESGDVVIEGEYQET